MAEWHIPFDYIVQNWTDEQFDLMCEKLEARKKRELNAAKGRHTVPIETLAASSRGAIRLEHGD